MWDRIIAVLIVQLQTDPALNTLLGGPHIYRNRSKPRIQTPQVAYTVISNGLEENYAPASVQWDIWAPTLDDISLIEQRLMKLMHSDLPVTIGGLSMWSQFQTGFDFAETDETIAHRAMEFKYTPARENES